MGLQYSWLSVTAHGLQRKGMVWPLTLKENANRIVGRLHGWCLHAREILVSDRQALSSSNPRHIHRFRDLLNRLRSKWNNGHGMSKLCFTSFLWTSLKFLGSWRNWSAEESLRREKEEGIHPAVSNVFFFYKQSMFIIYLSAVIVTFSRWAIFAGFTSLKLQKSHKYRQIILPRMPSHIIIIALY